MKCENKNTTISFRCTQEEKKRIEANASTEKLNLSNYIIHSCLNNSLSENSNFIVFLEKFEQFLIRFDKGKLKKKELIERMKKEVKLAWLTLK